MNWLTIAVIIFLAGMLAYGAHRGLVRMVMSFVAVILSLLIVTAVYQPVADLVRERTGIYKWMETSIGGYVESAISEAMDDTQGMIDGLMLPGVLKDSLRKGNTPGNYRELGVSTASEYVTTWLTDLVFSASVYVIVFFIVRIGILILTILLDSVMQLPVLKQINSLAGACLGLLLAVALLWVGGLIVTASATTGWGQEALHMINESKLLSMIYNHNYLISGILTP